MVASCFELIGVQQQELCQTGSEELQWMASVCHCGKCTTGRTLHGVISIAAGAAGVGVAGATAVGGLSAWVAGADVDAAGATSPMLEISGLTPSR